MAYVDSGVDVTVAYLWNAGESWQYLLNRTHSSDFVEKTFCVRFFGQDVSMLMRRQKKKALQQKYDLGFVL